MTRETRSLALSLLASMGMIAPWLVVLQRLAEMLR